MDLVNNLTLDWKDFTGIPDLTPSHQNDPGVYVWGFTVNGVFIPYYVGIANDIIFRILEHINSIISGRYTIFHRNSLATFYRFKDEPLQADMTKGKIYIPDWPYGFKNFLDRRKELEPHIDFMVKTFTFSYAVVDREIAAGKDLKDIEKICINQIGKEKLANTRAGYSNRFNLNHIGNPYIIECFKATNC